MKRLITATFVLAASPAALAAGPWDATFALQLSGFRADAAGPNVVESGASSSITSVQCCPRAVSVAATSQAM